MWQFHGKLIQLFDSQKSDSWWPSVKWIYGAKFLVTTEFRWSMNSERARLLKCMKSQLSYIAARVREWHPAATQSHLLIIIMTSQSPVVSKLGLVSAAIFHMEMLHFSVIPFGKTFMGSSSSMMVVFYACMPLLSKSLRVNICGVNAWLTSVSWYFWLLECGMRSMIYI